MLQEMKRISPYSEIQVWNSEYIRNYGRRAEEDADKIVVQCKELDSGDFLVEIATKKPMIEQDFYDKRIKELNADISYEHEAHLTYFKAFLVSFLINFALIIGIIVAVAL